MLNFPVERIFLFKVLITLNIPNPHTTNTPPHKKMNNNFFTYYLKKLNEFGEH